MTNGKGDKPRKGANLQRFRNNYSEIDWSKKETAQISLSGHQINLTDVRPLDQQERK